MEHLNEKSIFADLAQIEKILAEDLSGVRARQIIDYFEQCAVSNSELTAKVLDDSDRRLELKLNEGMRASKRIIQQVWETLHSKLLAH
jgi:regulatory protein YycI of two-component signal transduction system YycFG